MQATGVYIMAALSVIILSFFSFLSPIYTELCHMIHSNMLTLLWPMFLVTHHQYIQQCSVLIYFRQTL